MQFLICLLSMIQPTSTGQTVLGREGNRYSHYPPSAVRAIKAPQRMSHLYALSIFYYPELGLKSRESQITSAAVHSTLPSPLL